MIRHFKQHRAAFEELKEELLAEHAPGFVTKTAAQFRGVVVPEQRTSAIRERMGRLGLNRVATSRRADRYSVRFAYSRRVPLFALAPMSSLKDYVYLSHPPNSYAVEDSLNGIDFGTELSGSNVYRLIEGSWYLVMRLND